MTATHDTAPAPAARLVALLEEENAALRALDITAVGALLAAKRAALEALPSAPPGREVAERLHILARDNKRLLEQAMSVQGRVIGLVADAMRPPVAVPRYVRGGVLTPVRTASPLALSARV